MGNTLAAHSQSSDALHVKRLSALVDRVSIKRRSRAATVSAQSARSCSFFEEGMIVIVNQKHREYHEGTETPYQPPPDPNEVTEEDRKKAEKLRRALALNPAPQPEKQAPEEAVNFQPNSPASLAFAFSPLYTSTPPRTPSFRTPSPPPFLSLAEDEQEENMAAPAVEEIRASSYVGFDSITRQIEHKLLKRGFQFNVMVVGQTGLGKSTLINTIFASHLIDSKGRFEHDEPVRQTTEIQAASHVITENGVRLKLNIVDTPGYGDQINNEGCWDPIIKYIKDQHSAYLRKELTAMRDRYIQDTRIHCCLFFINPTGHSLRPIDIIVMKKLSEVVNVVPVIAKADSLTLEERDAFKERIRGELQYHNIRLYPIDHEDNEEEETSLNERIRSIIPFAVVGSERNVIIEGKAVRGRKNRWGVINVEDERHCEFVYLRNFLLRTHLQDLIETTAQIHYEAFRSKQLLALKDASSRPAGTPGA
ncbi:cell division control protein [Ceratobasidium sp. 392]|nr:cell division control protein [Ceratobasidium sp. 392]